MTQTKRTNPEVRQLAISLTFSDVTYPDYLVNALDLGCDRWRLEVLRVKGGASMNREVASIARRTVSFTQSEFAMKVFDALAGALPDSRVLPNELVKRVVAKAAQYWWEDRDVDGDAIRYAAELQEEAFAAAGRPMGAIEKGAAA